MKCFNKNISKIICNKLKNIFKQNKKIIMMLKWLQNVFIKSYFDHDSVYRYFDVIATCSILIAKNFLYMILCEKCICDFFNSDYI